MNTALGAIRSGRARSAALRARELGPSLSGVTKRIAPRHAVLLGFLALFAGCSHDTYQPDPARVQAPAGPATFDDCELGDGSTVPSAFPRGSLARPGPAELTLACGLSTQLAALGEPSLFPVSPSAEVYRVLWLRSDGHPVSVRFERQGTTGQVRGAQTAGKGVGTPGELLEETTSAATPDLVSGVLTRIEAARFWGAAPPTPGDTAVAERGSTWVFEGVKGGQYRVRVFQRETLARDPSYTALARTLVGSSGLHIEGNVY